MRRAERSLSSGSSAAQPRSTLDEVDTAVGAHEAVAGLGDHQVAAATEDPRPPRPRRAALCDRGSSGSTSTSRPSALTTTFWVTTSTSPSARGPFGSAAQASATTSPSWSPGRISPMPSTGQIVEAAHQPTHPHRGEARPGERGGDVEVAHDRVRHHAAHARGLDVLDQPLVGVVDDQRAGRSARTAGRRRRPTASSPSSASMRSAGPLSAASGHDRRHGHDPVAARAEHGVDAAHGAAAGRSTRSGWRARSRSRRRRASASSAVRAWRASAPSKRTLADRQRRGGGGRSTPGTRSRPRPAYRRRRGERHLGRDRVVGHRQDAQPEAPGGGDLGRDHASASPPRRGGRCGRGGSPGRGRRG